jgi:hypothetical protein
MLVAVDDLDYFEVDGPVSEEEHVFLSALRGRIDGRIYPFSYREDSSEARGLLVGLDITADHLVLLTVGLRFRSGRLHGDRMDSQLYKFPERPSSLAIDSEGSPVDLATVAAAWFDALMRRPIVRHEWLHEGEVYANRYVFADTGEALVQMYRQDLAPPGQPEQLINDGHVFGRGWIQTSGLGTPDREIAVGS